jgi:integrase
MGKGQKARALPLRGEIVLAAEAYMLEDLEGLGRAPEPDDFRALPGETQPRPQGLLSRPFAADGRKRRTPWWYRMCEYAGLVEKGQRSGLNLHRARHGFALEMRRAASLEAASQALGHSDLSTTMRH